MQKEQNIYTTKSQNLLLQKLQLFLLKTRFYANELLKFLLIFAAFCRIKFAAANFTPTNLPLAAASGKCDLYSPEIVVKGLYISHTFTPQRPIISKHCLKLAITKGVRLIVKLSKTLRPKNFCHVDTMWRSLRCERFTRIQQDSCHQGCCV